MKYTPKQRMCKDHILIYRSSPQVYMVQSCSYSICTIVEPWFYSSVPFKTNIEHRYITSTYRTKMDASHHYERIPRLWPVPLERPNVVLGKSFNLFTWPLGPLRASLCHRKRRFVNQIALSVIAIRSTVFTRILWLASYEGFVCFVLKKEPFRK